MGEWGNLFSEASIWCFWGKTCCLLTSAHDPSGKVVILCLSLYITSSNYFFSFSLFSSSILCHFLDERLFLVWLWWFCGRDGLDCFVLCHLFVGLFVCSESVEPPSWPLYESSYLFDPCDWYSGQLLSSLISICSVVRDSLSSVFWFLICFYFISFQKRVK